MKTDFTLSWTDFGRTVLTLGFLLVATSGCQTFCYTEEDLARERRLLAEGWANAPRGGWGCGGGIAIRPDLSNISLGNIGCPNVGSGICPGK
jgi:hypothetical protein